MTTKVSYYRTITDPYDCTNLWLLYNVIETEIQIYRVRLRKVEALTYLGNRNLNRYKRSILE